MQTYNFSHWLNPLSLFLVQWMILRVVLVSTGTRRNIRSRTHELSVDDVGSIASLTRGMRVVLTMIIFLCLLSHGQPSSHFYSQSSEQRADVLEHEVSPTAVSRKCSSACEACCAPGALMFKAATMHSRARDIYIYIYIYVYIYIVVYKYIYIYIYVIHYIYIYIL